MTWDEYLSAQSRPAPRDGIVRFRFNGLRERVYYDAPCALEEGSGCEVAVVLVHGWGGGIGRAAELAPMKRALAAATAPGAVPPYVVAPLFPRNDRVRSSGLGAPDDLASWNASWNVKNLSLRGSPDDDWRGGGDAVGTRLSSFDVIDRIFSAFADRTRYPNLRRVVLTGFSAGGQFAGRYAATGKGVVRDGVEVAYVAMAPSTELRLDPDVRWHYGIKDRPRYSAALTEADMLGNLSERRVWRACGTKDVLAMPYTSLDSCPEAMMQGTNRFERFRGFERYLERFPAWARQVSFHPIDGVGHNTVVAHCIPEFVDFVLHGDRNAGRRDK
jgi:dienelactone hydrolase